MFLKALGTLVKYNTNIAMTNIGFVFTRDLYFFEKRLFKTNCATNTTTIGKYKIFKDIPPGDIIGVVGVLT